MKLRPIINNKKGDILSILLVIIISTVVIVVLTVLTLVTNNITREIDSYNMTSSLEANQSISAVKDQAVPLADTMGSLLFIGWLIALIIAGTYTEFSPVVIGIFLLILLIGVYLSAVMTSNFYVDLSSEYDSSAIGGQEFTITKTLFGSSLPYIIAFIGLVIIIIMYSKKRGSAGGF